MIFNSIDFVIFFAVVYGLYVVLQHRAQNLLLLVASYFFYGWWDWRFCFLMALSTVMDYFLAILIADASSQQGRKRFILLSICLNLGLLFFFKYFNFFIDSTAVMLQALGFEPHLTTLQIMLPVGISFYTFQSMSYTIDVYRRELEPSRKFTDFAVFVSLFPQLVAGPIERATHLLPQVQTRRTIRYQDLREGAWLILLGYFKKTVIADNFALIANSVFNNPGDYEGLAVLLGIYAFAFQIYGDFSGYSDIARGIAKLMGFDLMLNFRMPYFSENPQEFWRRWHISLSTWLRDYLYISLGGNRGGGLMTYRNLFLTMLLGGIWHGAAWNYVFWGAYQGAILIIHRLFAGSAAPHNTTRSTPLRLVKVVLMFQVICFGWVLFRVNSLADVPLLMQGLLTMEISHLPWLIGMLIFLAPLFAVDVAQERGRDMYAIGRWRVAPRVILFGVLFLYICVSGRVDGAEFIYFQF